MGLQHGKPSAGDCETLICALLLERRVYNNGNITFFSVYLRVAKPSCNNVLQPSPLPGSGCNTLSHTGLANVNTRKRMFYPLIVL